VTEIVVKREAESYTVGGARRENENAIGEGGSERGAEYSIKKSESVTCIRLEKRSQWLRPPIN